MDDLKRALERARAELRMLYEIGNAMRSTLKLDEILYMILTAITCKDGLGFDRAMLFLTDDKKRTIDGTMAMGASTAKEAGRIWEEVESQGLTMDDLIYSYQTWNTKSDRPLNGKIKKISIPLNEDSGIIASACLEEMPFEINTPERRKKLSDPVLDGLKCNLFVVVPLYTRTKTLGTILADNQFSKREIIKDDIRLLTMFANHAGRAIANSRLYEETLHKSRTDSLSRLWNHATFQKMAGEAVEEAKRTEQPVSFLMIDIDHFKHYNDTAGHAAGDEVIRSVADTLRNHTRMKDAAARYGGEEFAVILPGADAERAFEAAERIRSGIDKRSFPKEKNQPGGSLTVSIGTATYPDNAKNKDTLLRKADMALYKAKQDGRNRTRTAT